MEEHKNRHSLFGPILLIALGVFLFLNAIKVIPGSMWGFVFRLWPLLFIAGGLDSLYKREGYTGPLVGIGIGTVFLLANLGYLSMNAFQLLLRLWPVLLIGWGFDLLLRPRTILTTVIGLVLGLMLIAGIIWLSLGTPFGAQSFNSIPVNQELGAAKQGDIGIVSPVGKLHLHEGAAADEMISGSIVLASTEKAEPEYRIDGETGYFKMEAQGISYPAPFIGGSDFATWDLSLNSEIPLVLSSQLITGQQIVDLTGLNVESFASETILGSLTLTLPSDLDVHGSSKVVMGELVVQVPEGEPVIISLDTAITTVVLPQGYTREEDIVYSPGAKDATNPINLEVEVPIGSLVIEFIP